jgi:hypothetical protein
VAAREVLFKGRTHHSVMFHLSQRSVGPEVLSST